MPAAAVIPAPIVYVNVAALKKSVAGFLVTEPLTRVDRMVLLIVLIRHNLVREIAPITVKKS